MKRFLLLALLILVSCAPAKIDTPTVTVLLTETVTPIPFTPTPIVLASTATVTPSASVGVGNEGQTEPEALVVHPQTVEGIPGMDMGLKPIDGATLYTQLITAFATGPEYQAYWKAAGISHPTADKVLAYAAAYAKKMGKDGSLILPEKVKDAEFPFLQSNGKAGYAAFKPNVQARALGYIDITDVPYMAVSRAMYDSNFNGVATRLDALRQLNARSLLFNDADSLASTSGLFGFYVDESGRLLIVGTSMRTPSGATVVSQTLGQGKSFTGVPTPMDEKIMSAMVDALIRATQNLEYQKKYDYVFDPKSVNGEGDALLFYVGRVASVRSYVERVEIADDLFAVPAQ